MLRELRPYIVYTRADGSIERGVFLDGRLIYESDRK
jgi:hypothetical protein